MCGDPSGPGSGTGCYFLGDQPHFQNLRHFDTLKIIHPKPILISSGKRSRRVSRVPGLLFLIIIIMVLRFCACCLYASMLNAATCVTTVVPECYVMPQEI